MKLHGNLKDPVVSVKGAGDKSNPNSPYLGRVLSEGESEKNTGIPDSVSGLARERIIISPVEGTLKAHKKLGNTVTEKEIICEVGHNPVYSPISGCIWGLVRDGLYVRVGQKIGDIDPWGKKDICFEITSHARTIAEGVLKGIHRFFSD